MLSKSKLNTISASEKGYYVSNDGEVISPKGIIRKCKISNCGYKYFNIKINGKIAFVFVHKLCAYKKYGYDSMLCECIRHLDGNKLNNRPDNISIGSTKENQLDIPKEKRLERCNSVRKWDREEVKAYYEQTKSYKQTMQHFGMSSKNALWFILHN